MDQEDLEFILRAKGSNMLRSGFQKDPFGCNMEDRLEECKWGGRTMLRLARGSATCLYSDCSRCSRDSATEGSGIPLSPFHSSGLRRSR